MTDDRPTRAPVWAGDLAFMALIIASVAVPGPGQGPGLGQVLGPGMGPGPGPGFAEHDLGAVVPAAAVVSALLMPLRRRWPVPVFATARGIYVVTVVLGVPALVPGIAAIVAVFATANSVARPVTLVCGVVGAGAVGLLSLFTDDRMALDPQVFQVAAGLAIATALGDSARSRREYTRAVTERAERAEQTRDAEARRRVAEERLRIAQDLHDTVAHRISVISLNAGVASSSLDSRPEKAREALGTIRAASREVLGDIGVLLRYLREGQDGGGVGGPDETGVARLPQRPQPGVGDIDELVRSVVAAGLGVDRRITGDLGRVDETTGRVVYRVVQEGLTNAHKHGAGNTAALRITADDGWSRLTVVVSNPVAEGSEGRNQPDAPQGHLGLTGLRERVSATGGTIDAVESAGTFTLTVELPLSLEEQP